jgi:hypothetical protein
MRGLANLGHVQWQMLADSQPMADTLGLKGIQNPIKMMGILVLLLHLADGVLEVRTAAHRNSIPGRFAHIRA